MLLVLAEIDWNTLLQKPDILPILLGFGTTAIVILGVTIAVQWRKAQQAKYEAELKGRMIERGFSAEEIKTVIQAGVGGVRSGPAGCGVVAQTPRERVDCCGPEPGTS